MEESIGMDLIRSIFSALDSAVYALISLFYKTLMDLANSTFINPSDISAVSIRIYSLLGIFMLFKVSFSLINFIINPDTFSDKEKGGAKLIKNVIITLVLVIMVPFGFDFLRDAQSAILNDQIIPKIMLGTEEETDFSSKSLELYIDSDWCRNISTAKTDNIGDYISLLAFRPFFQIESKVGKDKESDFEKIETDYCAGVKKDVWTTDAADFEPASVSGLLASSIYNSPTGILTTKHLYTVDYKWFLSTAVGVVVALLFLSFCFDTAVRMIKLGFLELIAPIPIISYIDPKSGKDGMFKKWYKEVIKTWASLFIRLAAVFFAIYIITLLADNGISVNESYGSSQTAKMWIELFILIGALMFAKQLPKLIEDILGIKMSGSLSLNPLKNIKDNALGGKYITGAAVAGTAMGVGAIGGAFSNIGANMIQKHNLKKQLDKETDIDKKNEIKEKLSGYNALRFLNSGVGGAFGAGRRGLKSGYNAGKGGKFDSLADIKKDITASNQARNNRSVISGYNAKLKEKLADGNITNEEYNDAKYSFLDRNLYDPTYEAFNVQNKDAGVGFFDEKIKEKKRMFEDNTHIENGINNQLSRICIDKNLDIMSLRDDFDEKTNSFKTLLRGPNEAALRNQLETQFTSLSRINKESRALQKEIGEFEKMKSAKTQSQAQAKK